MPEHEFYQYIDTASIDPDAFTISYTYTPSDGIQRMWEEHQRECDRQDREIEAQMRAEAELRENKRKYPLFFIKEGIV